MYSLDDLKNRLFDFIDKTWDGKANTTEIDYDLTLYINKVVEGLSLSNILSLIEENPQFINETNEVGDHSPYEMIRLNIEQYLFDVGYEYLERCLY